MYKTRIKEKWWFSQCGRTWLVCRKQLNTSGVTLNEPQTHQQTLMTSTYGYSPVATEVEIQFLRTLCFHLCWHSLDVPFSLLKKGCQYFWQYSVCSVKHRKQWMWELLRCSSEVIQQFCERKTRWIMSIYCCSRSECLAFCPFRNKH